jgi:hypothetical protein
MPRSLLAAVVAAVAVMTPAAAWAQSAPTLSFDQPCYSPGDTMVFSGAGYTPGGEVKMFFSSFSTHTFGQFDTQADPTGAIGDQLDSPDPDSFLRDDEWAGEIGVAANDKTRVDAGQGPDQAVGGAMFTLSRWDVQLEQPNGRAPRAAKRMLVTARGYTNARGDTLYVHYRRARRTVKTVKLGRLSGDCGDRTRTLRRGLPRGLRTGRYELVFNTSKRDSSAGPRITHKLRLR